MKTARLSTETEISGARFHRAGHVINVPHVLTALVLLVHVGLCATVHGQARPRAADRPKISPYLDLVNQGNNNNGGAGFQYFRRIRPDVEFRQAENKLRQNVQSLSKSVKDSKIQSEKSMLGTTGHAASFNTHGRYFNNGAASGGR